MLKNLDEYVHIQTKILSEIEDLENTSITTLKEKIKRLREVTKPLVLAGYYPDKRLGHLCSIIREKLEPYHIPSIEQRAGWFYDLFEEEERNKNSDKMSQNISSLPIEKQTGIEDVDRLKNAARNSEPLSEDYEYAKYLLKINEVSNETIKQSESILRKLESAFYFIKKFDLQYPDKRQLEEEIKNIKGKKHNELEELYTLYLNSQELIKNIESAIGTTTDKIRKLNETLSIQKFNSKQIDERSKITFLEKWNVIVCEIELGISAIAKKLGINKKHISNNIRPDENPVTHQKNMHHKYIDWFTSIKVISPKGEEFVFNAKEYFDKQIERGKLSIPFEPLILTNTEVKGY